MKVQVLFSFRRNKKKPISQMVRHKILILVFTGSNPVWAI